MIKQISVFMANETGALAKTTKFLAEHNINLRALSIADTQDFGILRIITDDSDKALRILQENDYTAVSNEVLAVKVSDEPGSLSKILAVLSNADVSIEYTYAFLAPTHPGAYMVFRVDQYTEAKHALREAGITVETKIF